MAITILYSILASYFGKLLDESRIYLDNRPRTCYFSIKKMI